MNRAATRRTIRIDLLPENVREKILALALRAQTASGYPTKQQVDRALRSIENGALGTGEGESDWAETNDAIAVGRVVMRFFAEHPQMRREFKNYLGQMQSSGQLVDRGSHGRRKRNGESEQPSAS